MNNIKTFEEFSFQFESKKGLWDNIRAKRKKGGKPAKPGDKDYPTEKGWKAAVKSSKNK